MKELNLLIFSLLFRIKEAKLNRLHEITQYSCLYQQQKNCINKLTR